MSVDPQSELNNKIYAQNMENYNKSVTAYTNAKNSLAERRAMTFKNYGFTQSNPTAPVTSQNLQIDPTNPYSRVKTMLGDEANQYDQEQQANAGRGLGNFGVSQQPLSTLHQQWGRQQYGLGTAFIDQIRSLADQEGQLISPTAPIKPPGSIADPTAITAGPGTPATPGITPGTTPGAWTPPVGTGPGGAFVPTNPLDPTYTLPGGAQPHIDAPPGVYVPMGATNVIYGQGAAPTAPPPQPTEPAAMPTYAQPIYTPPTATPTADPATAYAQPMYTFTPPPPEPTPVYSQTPPTSVAPPQAPTATFSPDWFPGASYMMDPVTGQWGWGAQQ